MVGGEEGGKREERKKGALGGEVFEGAIVSKHFKSFFFFLLLFGNILLKSS